MAKKPANAEGFDRVFSLVGGGGRYQCLLLALLAIQETVFVIHHVGYVFLGAVPDHVCQVEEMLNSSWTQEQIRNISIPRKTNDPTKWQSCHYYDLDYSSLQSEAYDKAQAEIDYTNASIKECTKWNYDNSTFVSTTVTDFNLVCQRRYLVATIQATYMGGVFAGSLVMGSLSDKVLGRRNSILASCSLVIICGFLASFATSYTGFVFFRFFIAMGVAGSFQNCFSLISEFCDSHSRAVFSLLLQTPFAFGYMIMPLFAYYIRDWANLQLAFSISTLTVLIYFWLLPESPRWLAGQGREEDAVDTLTKVARWNGKSKPNRLEVLVILEACKGAESVQNQNSRGMSPKARSACGNGIETFKSICLNYVNLVRTPELRKRSFLIWILFISVTLVYYGLSFDAGSLASDPFFPVFLSGLMEFPAYITAVPLAQRWGRTPSVAATFLISGAACLIVACVPIKYSAVRVSFSMVGKLFITACFSVIYLVATELYPTSARATGLGSAVLMGRFGSIMAPYVVDLTKNVYSDMPTIIFGVAGLIAGIITLFLPETKDTELLENITAVEMHAKVMEGNDQVMTKIVRRFSQPHLEPASLHMEAAGQSQKLC